MDIGCPAEKVQFIDHHLCHATTAYFGQGNMTDKILVLTCDGAGDGLSATINIGLDGKLERIATVSRANSVPILYSLMTYLLGFTPLEHEYKLMGMAPYSEGSSYSRKIADYFHTLFEYPKKEALTWQRLARITSTYDLGPEFLEELKFCRFDNLAGGIQLFIEEFFLEWIKKTIAYTGIKKLALAGGVFMNVKLNKRILELPEVESLFVFPSCGDESNSIGAGWATYADHCRAQKQPIDIPKLGNIYWGGDFTEEQTQQAIDSFNFAKKVKVTHHDNIEHHCAELLAKGQIVARSKGRLEFGARALGNHSILADPGNWNTIHVINAMIKKRDFWMPFAPSMLAEHADDYVVNPKGIRAPYMILSFDSKPDKRNSIIAATHPYDGSCRPQVVDQTMNPDYHKLISHYHTLTGNATVLNTSFNLHGFPIVYRPVEALEVFDKSGLKYLALGNFLVEEIDGSAA